MNVLASRDPLHREIAALREQVETLQAEIGRLHQINALDVFEVPQAWRLSPVPRRILSVLMKNSPRLVPYEKFYSSLRDPESDEERCDNTLKTHIVKIRRVLAKHVPGAVIDTVWGDGYRLPAASQALIEAAMGRTT